MAAVGTSSSISGPGSIVSGTGGGNSVSATADGENSGRWTQEEHERFLQGLDMYGKKWTKVAEVVSSRTTVQVRSHAQKYFQKMVKGGGRESMDVYSRPGMPGGGIPRPYRRQRLDNESIRKIPVPPPLQPFVTPGSGDIASGLYTYLSPSCVPTGTARSDSGEEGPTKVVTGRENDMTMAGGNGVVGPMNALMATSNDQHAPPAASSGIGMGTRVGNNDMNYIGDPTRTLPLSAQPTANMTTINVTGNVGVILDENGRQHHISNDVNKNTTEDLQNSVPEWYHKGKDIPNLLSAAENLDWLEDSGGPPGPPNTQQGGGGNAMPSVDGARSSALASNHNSQALYPQSTSSSDASLIAAAGQPISSGQLPPSHWYPMGHLMGASGPHPHAPYSSAPASSFSKGRGGGGAGGSSESNSAKTHVAKNFGHPSSSAISSGCSSVSSSSYSAATQLQTQHSSGGKKGWPQGHKASGGDSGRSNALSQRRPHGASFGEGDGSLALSASHNSGLDMASMDLDDSTFESIFNDEDDDMIFNQNNMP